ncbi:SDR family NAD(P)-dependent oxidoreductase [uncultured Ferrimonas sp.]|uniref:SDR family NAD(P)-dependent oxidoreductase n=1 Tax=uncultured Ferrimonas sp. TaxID=432640 RepID=UPI00262C5451|nr:SDR family NAD(P)-dependent oxidoreductase [uncultured Ferrimonas sp.]
MSITLQPTKPTPGRHRRVLSGIWRQRRNSQHCPELPRLDGQRALVTGGAAGIGEFISRGLIDRGAEVITLARGLADASGEALTAKAIYADLAQPDSIVAAVEQLGTTPVDLLICNAGLLSKQASMSANGVETTFAVNVLGHHILYRLLMERGLLSSNARIVLTSGDIYILAQECSPTIPFDGTAKAYSRSKLGNLWQVAELTKRYPQLHSSAVHPGVVASGFGGSKQGLLGRLRSRQLISEAAGAQASLIAATQALPRGAYWHNVFGLVDLPKGDPALNATAAARLWDQLEALAAPYLK